jgi:GT2 family glycosyltransferase
VDKKVLIGLSTGEHIRKADFLPYFLSMMRPNNSLTVTVHGQSPAKSRNLIVEEAIKNNCTHIFFVDDDIILPQDTLMKLLVHDKDIVSGLYLLRSFPHRPALFDEAYESGKCKFIFLDDHKGLVKGVNCGLGCVLISMKVFEALEKPYVRLGEIEQDGWCDDVGFFNRCRQAGFDIYCDLDAAVGHQTSVILWPEKHDGKWMTNYKHQNGNVLISQNIPSLEELKEEKNKEIALV